MRHGRTVADGPQGVEARHLQKLIDHDATAIELAGQAADQRVRCRRDRGHDRPCGNPFTLGGPFRLHDHGIGRDGVESDVHPDLNAASLQDSMGVLGEYGIDLR